MSTLTLQAPAKLNLSLRVLGKRADGFHDIDTLMVKLPGLFDRIEFTAAQSFSFECDDSELPTGEGNLVAKAVRAYEAALGKPVKFSIRLEKSVPHGAGLGGGSSDAATTLAGLDQLHGGALGATLLHEIAAALGSDIPFFLTPGAARCTGRGEIITAVPSPAPLNVLLLKPLFSCPTPEAYRNWADSRWIVGVDHAAREIAGVTLVNDLEAPVFSKHLFLAELKQWLLGRPEVAAALLCGSGSTVFAVLKDHADPDALAKTARYELDPNLWHWAGVTG
jgi:4-diphosphocytidyl-2-C-methyl-D-erythritol kinase